MKNAQSAGAVFWSAAPRRRFGFVVRVETRTYRSECALACALRARSYRFGLVVSVSTLTYRSECVLACALRARSYRFGLVVSVSTLICPLGMRTGVRATSPIVPLWACSERFNAHLPARNAHWRAHYEPDRSECGASASVWIPGRVSRCDALL